MKNTLACAFAASLFFMNTPALAEKPEEEPWYDRDIDVFIIIWPYMRDKPIITSADEKLPNYEDRQKENVINTTSTDSFEKNKRAEINSFEEPSMRKNIITSLKIYF